MIKSLSRYVAPADHPLIPNHNQGSSTMTSRHSWWGPQGLRLQVQFLRSDAILRLIHTTYGSRMRMWQTGVVHVKNLPRYHRPLACENKRSPIFLGTQVPNYRTM